MTNSPHHPAQTTPPDKDHLYGRYEAGEAWKRQLHRKGAYKALDIADEDMGDIHANRIGITWKELAVIAVLIASSIGGTAYLMSMATSRQPTAAPTTPLDSEYEVRFFDAQGRPIEVEPVNRRSLKE